MIKKLLNIHDFPIRIKENCLINAKGEVLLNFSLATNEQLVQFIIENIDSINDGKRVYKKRLTKTLSSYGKEDAIDIVKTEMFNKQYILINSNICDIEYTIIYKEGKIKLCFNKINFNMEKDNKEEIKQKLYQVLFKIIDGQEKENITDENKEIATKDIIKFLNLYYNNIIKDKNAPINNLFNEHQKYWFYALTKITKEIQHPLIKVNAGLFRYYIITLFSLKGEVDLLKKITGWTPKMLEREKMTYDTKVILLSVSEILKNQNNKEENKE